MKHGTLVVNDVGSLMDDIWQYEAEWKASEFEKALESFAITVGHAREVLERLADEELQDEFLDDELYVLGDIQNFFDAIDVEVKGEKE